MTYASIIQQGHPTYPESVTGCAVLQGVQFNGDLGGYLGVSVGEKRYLDYETFVPALEGYGSTRSKSRDDEIRAFAQRMQLEGAGLASIAGGPLALYGPCPIGSGWQYDQSAKTNAKRAKDNARFAALDPFKAFSDLCIDCYVWQDDYAGGEDAAFNFSSLKLSMAKVYGKNLIAFISPVYVGNGGGGRLKDETLRGLLRATADVDRCIWYEVANEQQVTDTMAWMRGVATAAGLTL